MDILFRTDEYVFSYRVAGICIEEGKVLLQKPINDTAFAFPGFDEIPYNSAASVSILEYSGIAARKYDSKSLPK